MSADDPEPGRSMLGELAPKSSRPAIIDLAAVAVPPSVWFVHLNVSYVLVPPSCRAGHRWYLLAVTVLALVLMVPAALRAVRARRAADPEGLEAFLGSFGLWFTGLFALVTLLVGMSALVVGPCG